MFITTITVSMLFGQCNSCSPTLSKIVFFLSIYPRHSDGPVTVSGMRDQHEFTFFSIFSKTRLFLDTAGLSVPVLDPDYTALDKFLIGQVFLPVCNPFTRNRANFVTVLFKRVRTNFCQSHHWNGFFFYQRRVTILQACAKTCTVQVW